MANVINVTARKIPTQQKSQAEYTTGRVVTINVADIVKITAVSPAANGVNAVVTVKTPGGRGRTGDYRVQETQSALVTAINA